MFRALLCPSSGAHDDSVGYHIGRLVLVLRLVGSLVQLSRWCRSNTHQICGINSKWTIFELCHYCIQWAISRSVLRRWETFQAKVIAKNKIHILWSVFFSENRAVYEIMWKKYCRAGQATDDNMAHIHFTMDIQGSKSTIRICNTYCFHAATMVARKGLNIRLYVHCPPW